MKPDDLISEARARIIWGESSSAVRSFLTANGITELDADAVIKEFIAERNSEIRKIGMKWTLIGAALIIASAIFFYWSLLHVDIDKMNSRSARGFVVIAISIALGGLYGLSKLIDGIRDLVRPQSEEKSISELS